MAALKNSPKAAILKRACWNKLMQQNHILCICINLKISEHCEDSFVLDNIPQDILTFFISERQNWLTERGS